MSAYAWNSEYDDAEADAFAHICKEVQDLLHTKRKPVIVTTRIAFALVWVTSTPFPLILAFTSISSPVAGSIAGACLTVFMGFLNPIAAIQTAFNLDAYYNHWNNSIRDMVSSLPIPKFVVEEVGR